MANFVQVNFFSTTISAAITSGDTSINLGSTVGAPTIPSGYNWPLILTANNIYEIVYGSALNGSTLTVLRGQEGSSAQSWSSGTTIFGAFTAGSLLYQGQSISANSITSGTLANARLNLVTLLEQAMLSSAVTLEPDPGTTPSVGTPGSVIAYY